MADQSAGTSNPCPILLYHADFFPAWPIADQALSQEILDLGEFSLSSFANSRTSKSRASHVTEVFPTRPAFRDIFTPLTSESIEADGEMGISAASISLPPAEKR